MPGKAARRLLLDWLDRLIAGKVAPEIQLDLIEAAARRTEPEFREKIKKYESTKRPDDPLAAFREVLAGGDKERGRQLFTSKAEIECVRCHKVRGPGGESAGGEVGPELSGVGARLSRADLLESIVNPNKQIAQGFESVVHRDGRRQGADRDLARRRRQGSAAHDRGGKVHRRRQGYDRRAQARAIRHAGRRRRQAHQERAARLDRVSRRPEGCARLVPGFRKVRGGRQARPPLARVWLVTSSYRASIRLRASCRASFSVFPAGFFSSGPLVVIELFFMFSDVALSSS